jgi:hypothetical protein
MTATGFMTGRQEPIRGGGAESIIRTEHHHALQCAIYPPEIL